MHPKHLPQDVEACLTCEANREDVEQQLKRAMDASPVGAKMFWAGAQRLQNSRSMALVQKAIAALGEDINVNGLTEALQQLKSDLSNSGVDMHEILGVTLMTYVASYWDEWEIRKEAHVRSVVLSGGLLEPIFCEAELAPMVRVENAKVEPALLSATRQARAAMRGFIPDVNS